MSITNWKQEFYPVTAAQIYRKTRNVGALIEHCLRKWRGATWANLRRHKLTLICNMLYEGEKKVFTFDDKSCALCKKFYNKCCTGCPLNIGGEPCFSEGRGYRMFERGGGPELMIQELEWALEEWRSENGQS